jgi:hypothetical protein
MKLRIRGNSIRLRLTRSEVDRFSETGRVEESVDFGADRQKFVYALAIDDRLDSIGAEYHDNVLSVLVPENIAREWAGTDLVGIGTDESAGLSVLIEKDFACLTPRQGQDESDMFANPASEPC